MGDFVDPNLILEQLKGEQQGFELTQNDVFKFIRIFIIILIPLIILLLLFSCQVLPLLEKDKDNDSDNDNDDSNEPYIPDLTTYSYLQNTKNNKLLNIYRSKLGSFFRNKMDNIRNNYQNLGYDSDMDIGQHIYVHNNRYIYDPLHLADLPHQPFQPNVPSHEEYSL